MRTDMTTAGPVANKTIKTSVLRCVPSVRVQLCSFAWKQNVNKTISMAKISNRDSVRL